MAETMNIKRIIAVLMLVAVLASIPGITLAEDEDQQQLRDEREKVGKVGILDTLFGSDNSGQKEYYYLDLAEKEEEGEESFWVKFIPFGGIISAAEKQTVFTALYVTTNWFNNLILRYNEMMTGIMLAVWNFANEFDFVKKVITHLDVMMQNLTGISETSFGEGKGLFNAFLGIVAVLTAAYAAFVFLWKRSSLESLGTILQTVTALTLALLLFSNYGTFLMNANKLTTEASGLIMTGSADKLTGNDRTNEEVLRETNRNIKRMFIHRPYLFMQYGTDNEEAIGRERVNELLQAEPGSEKRKNIVREEVNKKGNQLMTSAYVLERFVFSWFYTGMNALNSIPIYLMSLLLIVLQFWFLGIAAVAPFAFLFAALPGQFGVLRRYMAQLFLPLALKLLLSAGAVFVFFITSLLYAERGFGSVNSYIAVGVVQFIVLMLVFFLRKRIYSIFSEGSRELRMLRAEMALLRKSMLSPVKTGVQTATTAAGAVIGAVATGGVGALAGAAIGSKVGKMVTGEGDMSDVASEANRLSRLKLPDKDGKKGKEGQEKGKKEPRQEDLEGIPTVEDLRSKENIDYLVKDSEVPDLPSLEDLKPPEDYEKAIPGRVNESLPVIDPDGLNTEQGLASLESYLPRNVLRWENKPRGGNR